jgi:O-antigen ligase
LKVHPGIVLLLGYVVISGLSVPPVLSGHPPEWTGSAANELLRLSTGIALFLSATYLFRLIPYQIVLGLALAGATLAALLAVGDFFGFLPFEGQLRGLLSNFGRLRASGGFSDPNFLGEYMALAVVFGLGALALARRPMKLLLAPIAILGVVCVAVTFSRGAYLAVLVGLVVLIGTRNRAVALVVVILAGIVALTLYPAFLDARIGVALSPHEALALLRSENSRTDLAAAAFAIFASSPVFGIGFGVFHFVSPSFAGDSASIATYSHNQFLNILAEQGIVGVLLVTGIAVLLIVALAKSRSPLRWAALAMGATYLVLSLFINSTTDFQGSSLLWLVMAAALTPGPERTVHVMEA